MAYVCNETEIKNRIGECIKNTGVVPRQIEVSRLELNSLWQTDRLDIIEQSLDGKVNIYAYKGIYLKVIES